MHNNNNNNIIIIIIIIPETHFEYSVHNTAVLLEGYSVFRRGRDKHGGGVAIYIQSHQPSKMCLDFMCNDLEVLWVQEHLTYLKPVLVGF